MIRNFIAIALRNIIRHKLHSFINIAGLAVGLACAILIALFVRDELSYDKWIPGSENLWRVEVTYHVPGRSDPIHTAQASMPLTMAMRDQIPEVRSATRLMREFMTLTSGNRQFLETVGVVDANFLKVIPLSLVEGDPRTVLAGSENIVVSESAARRYFGSTDPIGKTLTADRGDCGDDTICTNKKVLLKVAGVMRDLPHNTQLDFNFLMPNSSLADQISQHQKKDWLNAANTFGYVTLAPGADRTRVLAKLRPILDRNIDLSAFTNVKIPGSRIVEPKLTRFRDAHLTTDQYFGMRPPGSRTTVYGMCAIGILILLVACFNFMNLTTARASTRAREISLRKCLGASRAQLIMQFLGEAMLMAFVALLVALALTEVLLPAYSKFVGRPLKFDYLADWQLTLAILGLGMLTGLLSGLYPALVLSSFRPADTLRGGSSGHAGSGRLRMALVVFQFAVSIGLGIGAAVVFQQVEFARSIDLGFRRDNIVFTSTGGHLGEDGIKSFIQALERGPGVLKVARTSFMPFYGNNSVLPVQRPGDAQFLSPNHISVTQDYFDLFNIRLKAGRVLEDNREEDNFYQGAHGFDSKNEGHNVIVNASLARALGYSPSDIVGKNFIFAKSHMRVVGVVADTLTEGTRSPALQTVYVHTASNLQNIVIRVAPDRLQEAMAFIGRTQHAFVPEMAFDGTLLRDSYERLYKDDERQGQIFAIFVSIAIFIACLGLFGLAAFTAGRRTKEIGIRKVFGAGVRDLTVLLLWQFSIPVLIANLIAWPIAWYYLHTWLKGFAYRVPLSPLYFLGAGATALLIAWITVFTHARRVANANPVHALRYE